MSTALDCWKKYYWKYIEGLTPRTDSKHLFLGHTIHATFEMYYHGFSRQECLDFLTNSFDRMIGSLGPHEQEDFVISKYIAMGMWSNYPLELNVFQEIKSEKKTSVPLTRGIAYDGRIDGLVKYQDHWWVLELKTSSLSPTEFSQRMRSHAQATGYVWVAQKLGYPVVGIIFDVIRKPLLRKGSSENQDQFGQRIMSDYKNRPHNYYFREFSYRTPDDVERWRVDTVNFIDELKRKKRTQRFYRNCLSCFSFHSECPYYKVCFQSEDPMMIDLYYTKEKK